MWCRVTLLLKFALRIVGFIVALAVGSLATPASAGVLDEVTAAAVADLRTVLSVTGVHVYYASTAGSWGFATWTAGEGGGDSIMRRAGKGWKVLQRGHGAMTESLLTEGFRVPPTVAAALMSGRCPKVPRGHTSAHMTSLFVRRVGEGGKPTESVARCAL